MRSSLWDVNKVIVGSIKISDSALDSSKMRVGVGSMLSLKSLLSSVNTKTSLLVSVNSMLVSTNSVSSTANEG